MAEDSFRVEFAFWLRIMKEHALFLETGFEFYQMPLIREAACFFHAYRELEAELAAGEPLAALAGSARELTEQFRDFKLRVLALALRCRPGGSGNNLPAMVNHISEEAEQFLRFLRYQEPGAAPGGTKEIVDSIEFWLEVMVEHLRFIRHLLDPSQEVLLLQAAALIARGDPLSRQIEEYGAMLRAAPEGFPALVRGIDDVIAFTRDVRDFKAAALVLLQNCGALAVAPALLADHVRREAEHFLAVLATARQELAPLLDVPPQSLDADEIHRDIWAAAGAPPPATKAPASGAWLPG